MGVMFSTVSCEPDFFSVAGARPPDRYRTVDTNGITLAVYEWGNAEATPLILVHGGLDFARTFDVFAPLLADGGYRVVAYDQRGHGDSEHTALYSWVADERDMLAVIDSVTLSPCIVIGHSKGGALLAHAIQALPHRFSHFIAIDGLPFRKPHSDSTCHERHSLTAPIVADWLDNRRAAHGAVRKPGTIEELARRRARMNPRLSHEWLCYLATKGARRDPDGWRWKIDPALQRHELGPFHSRWMTNRLPGFPIAMLAIFGTVSEPMGWDATPSDLMPYFPFSTDVKIFEDTGHFIHVERPEETAALILDYLQP